VVPLFLLVFSPPYATVDGDHPTEDEFLKNFAMAQNRLQEAMPTVLDFVMGKTLDQL